VSFATSILVATDLSPASYAALAEAARLAALPAKNLGGEPLPVRILHVFDVAPFRLLPPAATLPSSTLRRIAEEANGAAHSVLLGLCGRFFQGLTRIEIHIEQHDGAAAGICASAQAHGVDLIVMGSHGRSGRGASAYGSTTAKVVRSAPCRVLVVPADDPESHTH
jgi:nucleotide-binding universal stress UspA family protein